MRKRKSRRKYSALFSSIAAMAFTVFVILGCSAGVDIGETSKYLNSFQIVWPDGFTYSCIHDISVRITVNAMDQNGQVYTNWSGSNIAIEIQYGDVDVSPDFFDMAGGTKKVDITFSLKDGWINNKTSIRVIVEGKYSSWSQEITVQDIFGAGIDPPDGSLLVGHQPIVVTFNAAADTGTLTFSGLGSFSADWAPDDKSVKLTPDSFWTAGDGKSVTLFCDAAGDSQSVDNDYSFDVFHGVCVSKDEGSSGNTGTTEDPLDTIQNGIDYASGTALYSTAEVRVAATITAAYQWNYSADEIPLIDMVEGISVYGGYSDSNWSAQNTIANETILEDTSDIGGSDGDPDRVLYCGSGITSSTIIDGFTIKTGAGNANAGIFCDGGSPTIQNNTIQWTSAGQYSASIHTNSASPVIKNNKLYPGTATTATRGIYNVNSSSTIQGNTIYSGSAALTYGIYCTGTPSPVISNGNIIDGGSGNPSAHCISILNSHPTITGNEFIFSSGNTKGIGVYENGTSADPASLQTNDFNFQPDAGAESAWYRDDDGTLVRNLTTDLDTQEGTHTLEYWGNYTSYNP
jgi:hypothetical protein